MHLLFIYWRGDERPRDWVLLWCIIRWNKINLRLSKINQYFLDIFSYTADPAVINGFSFCWAFEDLN